MATILKVGPLQYQAQVRRKGWPHAFKTFEKRSQAVEWASIVEADMSRGTYINRSEAESTTLHEALERYETEVSKNKKSYDSEKWRISQWKRNKLSKHSLATLKSTDFAKYRDERLEAGIKPATIRNDLAVISHLFVTAQKEWNIPVANPIAGIRKPHGNNSRNRRLSKEEEQRIMLAIKGSINFAHGRSNIWIEPIFQLALETAMRKEEILALTWSNVDLENSFAHLPTTKNGKSRDVPLSKKALDLLCTLQRTPTRDLRHDKVFPTTSSALDQSWRRAVNRARKTYEAELTLLGKTPEAIENDQTLTDLHFHDLRHEAITRLAAPFGIHELMKITGHSDTRMLARYYHPKASDLAKKLHKFQQNNED